MIQNRMNNNEISFVVRGRRTKSKHVAVGRECKSNLRGKERKEAEKESIGKQVRGKKVELLRATKYATRQMGSTELCFKIEHSVWDGQRSGVDFAAIRLFLVC
uniref:Uncharacterized protein n=1 Tax=Onchocerca volvulus TaxID=6282 RepID=A0A8R1TRB0_ONCVO